MNLMKRERPTFELPPVWRAMGSSVGRSSAFGYAISSSVTGVTTFDDSL